MRIIINVLFFVLCLCYNINAQNIHFIGSSDFLKLNSVNKKFSNRHDTYKYLDSLVLNMRDNGFLQSSLDTCFFRNDTVFAEVFKGPRYRWAGTNLLTDNIISNSEFYKVCKKYNSLFFSEKTNTNLINDFLFKLADKAYPFAHVRLKEIKFNRNDISLYWNIVNEQKYAWDKLIIKGNASIRKSFLFPYLGINYQQEYSEKIAVDIDDKINKLNFIKTIKPSEFEFDNIKAKTFLYLNKKNVNQFFGIIGLYSDKKTNKIHITGDFKIKLLNTFSFGEEFTLNWKALEENSQKLKLNIKYPFILSSKIGLDMSLMINKKDSLYINTNMNIKTNIFISKMNNINVFFSSDNSYLLSTNSYKNNTTLPKYIDSKMNLFGLGCQYNNLDYNFNPSKGFSISSDIALAKRNVKKNANIKQTLYKGIIMSQNLLYFNLDANVYIPISRNISIHMRSYSSGYNTYMLFNNEQITIGGLNSLRGFDEDFYKPKLFSLLSSEIKLIPEKNTSLYVFYDFAYLDFKKQNANYNYTPYSFGLGFNFFANYGVFSLTYAVGKYKNQKIDTDKAKIHFGFISTF